jgi:hypothetical protein
MGTFKGTAANAESEEEGKKRMTTTEEELDSREVHVPQGKHLRRLQKQTPALSASTALPHVSNLGDMYVICRHRPSMPTRFETPHVVWISSTAACNLNSRTQPNTTAARRDGDTIEDDRVRDKVRRMGAVARDVRRRWDTDLAAALSSKMRGLQGGDWRHGVRCMKARQATRPWGKQPPTQGRT